MMRILSSLFGCSHQRTTFPITPTRDRRGREIAIAARRTHVTCLDCGREFPYSWQDMRILKDRRPVEAPIESEARA